MHAPIWLIRKCQIDFISIGRREIIAWLGIVTKFLCHFKSIPGLLTSNNFKRHFSASCRLLIILVSLSLSLCSYLYFVPRITVRRLCCRPCVDARWAYFLSVVGFQSCQWTRSLLRWRHPIQTHIFNLSAFSHFKHLWFKANEERRQKKINRNKILLWWPRSAAAELLCSHFIYELGVCMYLHGVSLFSVCIISLYMISNSIWFLCTHKHSVEWDKTEKLSDSWFTRLLAAVSLSLLSEHLELTEWRNRWWRTTIANRTDFSSILITTKFVILYQRPNLIRYRFNSKSVFSLSLAGRKAN